MPTYMTVRRVRGPAWNSALPMRSQALWAEHAAFMNALAAEGLVQLGGLLGAGEDVLLVFDTDSEETVRARLAADPWTTAGLLEIRRVEPWTILLDGRSS
jgi:uncharacterized protein YciI